MKLTDNEKREILKLIEADKPRKPKPLTDANTRKSGKSIRAEIQLGTPQ